MTTLEAPNADLLDFDEETHTYRLGLEILPSVTTILQPVVDFSSAPAFMVEYKAQLGTAVHKACELWDLGDLDDDIDPRITPYLSAWQKFVGDTSPRFWAIEERRYQPEHRYAGTIDRLAKIGNRGWCIDIKTSASLNPSVGLQLAAYQRLVPGYIERAAVHLKPDGTYKFVEYTDANDFDVFLALLRVYRWRQATGGLK